MEINSAISTTDTFTKGNEKKKKIILQSKNVKKCYFLIVKLWHAGQILLLEICSWKVSESQERYKIWVKTVFSNSFIYKLISKISLGYKGIYQILSSISLQN